MRSLLNPKPRADFSESQQGKKRRSPTNVELRRRGYDRFWGSGRQNTNLRVLLVQIKLQRATGCQAKNNDILKTSVETVPLAKHPFALPLPDNLRYNVVPPAG